MAASKVLGEDTVNTGEGNVGAAKAGSRTDQAWASIVFRRSPTRR